MMSELVFGRPLHIPQDSLRRRLSAALHLRSSLTRSSIQKPRRELLLCYDIFYFRRMSSTHDIAAMVVGKPIVVIASTPTCLSSSAVQPASNARRVWLCTAPSRPAPTAIASLTSARVLLSNGPADCVASPSASTAFITVG